MAILWRVLQSPAIVVQVVDKPTVIEKTSSGPGSTPEKPAETKVVPPPPPPVDPAAALRDAVFLVQVESAGRFWPLATCVAVDKQTLLTSGREAMQLATWREKDGFKPWIVNPALGIKKEVREIRLHGVFASLADEPNDWIYFDLALLTVEGELPRIAPLASPVELAELSEDTVVRGFGFVHDGQKAPAGAKFATQLVEGRILMTPVAENLPGRPRLLLVEAKFPQNAYGWPIIDAKGKVVGVYGAAAPVPSQEDSPAAASAADIHYAAIVVPDVIRRWTEKRDSRMWARRGPSQRLPRQVNKPRHPKAAPHDLHGRNQQG